MLIGFNVFGRTFISVCIGHKVTIMTIVLLWMHDHHVMVKVVPHRVESFECPHGRELYLVCPHGRELYLVCGLAGSVLWPVLFGESVSIM